MLKNFADRGIPLIGMEKYPLLPDHKQRFLNAGFSNVEIYTMLQMYNSKYLVTIRFWTKQKKAELRN